MTNINGLQFDGPFSIRANFNPVAGVYLVVNSSNNVVDVGETDSLKDRIPSHERQSCWSRNSSGVVSLYFHHEGNQQLRLQKESNLRGHFNPACGVR